MAGYDIWIWVAIIVVSLIVEFTTMELTSIWFSVGGLVALILAAFNVMFEVQVILFIIISAVLLLTLRRWTKNKLLDSAEGNTNLDLIKKEKFELLTPITKQEKGTIKYNGVIWSVVSKLGEELQAGTIVEVIEVKGNKLIVKKEGK